MRRLKKRTLRKKIRGGWTPWTSHNWPQQHDATYYPVNSYNSQIDRTLRITNVGGTRRRK
jgi:hypothetical protein